MTRARVVVVVVVTKRPMKCYQPQDVHHRLRLRLRLRASFRRFGDVEQQRFRMRNARTDKLQLINSVTKLCVPNTDKHTHTYTYRHTCVANGIWVVYTHARTQGMLRARNRCSQTDPLIFALGRARELRRSACHSAQQLL